MARKRTILVTGGAGYIGAHVVHELLESGYEVAVLDLQDNVFPAEVKYYQGDFADPELLGTIFSENRIAVVIHLAAFIDALESISKPEEYLENNSAKTLRLAEQMIGHGVKRLVFASSAAVYGPQDKVPITELAECNPSNPYGRSKLLAEQNLQRLANEHDFTAIALRFFNVSGSKPGTGIRSRNRTSLFAQLAQAIASDQEFLINGDDLATADGTAVRDFIHVQDVARACVMAAQELFDGKGGLKIYNVASGTGYSIREIIAAAEALLGKSIRVAVRSKREGDIPISIASIQKIQKELSFEPAHSDLEVIIKTSL